MSFNRKDLEKSIAFFNKLQKSKAFTETTKIFAKTLLRISSSLLRDLEGLKQENEVLKKRIENLEYSKSSENSSLAPSLDPNRKRGRKKVNKPKNKLRSIGAQKGHPGSTLKQEMIASETIVYPLKGRCDCGQTLSELDQISEQRQVFEIEVKKKVISHKIFKSTCKCGQKHSSNFPGEVKSPVQYGRSVQALSSYLRHYQLIPYERVQEIFKDIFSLSLSKGTVNNHINKVSIPLRSYTMWARHNLLESKLNFADETTTQISKDRYHLHNVSNLKTTLIEVHKGRGKDAVKSMGVLERYKGKLVHDCYAMYFGYPCEDIICNAHLQRELEYFCSTEKYSWAYEMKIFLYSLYLETNSLRSTGKVKRSSKDYKKILKRYRLILRGAKKELKGLINKKKKKQEKVVNLYLRLKKHEKSILLFSKDFSVPFTNNQAERDLRMSKVHLKISGCFRSLDMARNWCLMRSFISTLKKRDINVFESIKRLIDPQEKSPIYSILGPPI